MAAHWISGKLLTKEGAKKEIIALSRFEEKRMGHSVDTSAADTWELFEEYYGYDSAEVRYDIALADMAQALAEGALLIVPADGRRLKNPNFTQPGPLTHMLVVIGYDAAKKAFITHDPGTRKGERYRYDEDILFAAMRDYPTGKHLPIRDERAAMILVKKPPVR
jgi:hypothetical protein